MRGSHGARTVTQSSLVHNFVTFGQIGRNGGTVPTNGLGKRVLKGTIHHGINCRNAFPAKKIHAIKVLRPTMGLSRPKPAPNPVESR